MDKPFTACSRCKTVINYGNAYVSIVRNVEQADFFIAKNSDEITVLESKEIITLCASCGNVFNAENVEKIINSIPTDDSDISSN